MPQPSKPQQATLTTTDLSLKRRHEILLAADWDKVVDRYRKANDAQKKVLRAEVRYEVSVQDLRDEVVGLVASTFGKGEDGWREVHARGGPHYNTLRNWDQGIVLRPQLAKLREAALTCGFDFTLVSRKPE